MHLKIDQKLTHYLMPVLVLSVACTFFLTMVRQLALPLWRQIVYNTTTEGHYRSLLANGEGFRMLSEQYSQRQRLLEDKLAQLKGGYDDMLEVSQFIQLVYDAAWKENGDAIKFKKTLPQTEVKGTLYDNCPVVFELSSDYAALGNLVAFLERIPHIARIDGIACTTEEDGKSLQTTLLVTAFIKTQPGESR
jgi:Tfp pilus assembly protein PilO